MVVVRARRSRVIYKTPGVLMSMLQQSDEAHEVIDKTDG